VIRKAIARERELLEKKKEESIAMDEKFNLLR
jgi:hypothetical protein